MKKAENILLISLTIVFILAMTIISLLSPDEKYSYSERRALAQAPAISSKTVLNGRFMTDFEDYITDQFPFRDSFRSIKAFVRKNVFLQKDNHGLYYYKGHLSKIDYPLNEKLYSSTLSKLNRVYDEFIKDTDCRVYAALIPDKNMFLAPEGGYPAHDFGELQKKYASDMPFADYIDISGTVSLDSFYYTDQHWRQETLVPTAECLLEGLGRPAELEFSEYELDKPFYGAYYGQAALKLSPDKLAYLNNDVLDNCIVTSYNTGKAKAASVYNMEKAAGRDPYEMFMEGSDALITIENPEGEGELIIFRDSFGSSITPLLIQNYGKITLVDLRYLNTKLISSFIEFENQDVLFLYSSLILNSGAIK